MKKIPRQSWSLIFLAIFFLPSPLRAQRMADVLYKVFPVCANSSDPRNTLEDVRIAVYVDRKLLRPTGGFAETGLLHYLRVVAEPKEGVESSGGNFFIQKIEWMKCAAGVNGVPVKTETREFQTREAVMTVFIDSTTEDKSCYKAMIYVEKCGGTKKAQEAAVKFITTATHKTYKEEKATDQVSIQVGNEKIQVGPDGTGFAKLPNKKITFRVNWEGKGMSDPGLVTIRNTKTNSSVVVPRLPNKIAYIHEYTVDLAPYAGTENLYDYEIRVNMIYEPRGATNEVRVLGVIPGVAVHKAGTPEEEWKDAKFDMVLQQGDEISCDPDGGILLQFADNSTVLVRNTTQLKIASFFTEGGVVKTEILLKMGEVAAKVHKSEATKSDFVIKPPGGPGSVRGTTFSMKFDPPTQTTFIKVEEGIVDYTPEKSPASKITLKTGQQVKIEKDRIGPIMPFTEKIDFNLPDKNTITDKPVISGKPPVISDPLNDISGTWLLTQGSYTGTLKIRQAGNVLSGDMNWSNHQKAAIESGNFFYGSVLFVLAYAGDLRGNYQGKLNADGNKLEGECISNKGTADKWTAVRQ